MTFNKIPFGLNELNNEIVDVYDVQNGKLCGCICPSCRTPLEARQGDVNVWHFAHSSKKVYTRTKSECQYSYYVSVRLMARQIIGKQLELWLPEFKGTVINDELGFPFTQKKEFVVSKMQEIVIENVEVEKSFADVPVDLIGTVRDYDFIVYFTHPCRDIPANLFHLQDQKCGVIAISLEFLQFQTAHSDQKTYLKILSEFLTEDRYSKTWIYHPRYALLHSQAVNALKDEVAILKDKKAEQLKNKNTYPYQDILASIGYSVPKKLPSTYF